MTEICHKKLAQKIPTATQIKPSSIAATRKNKTNFSAGLRQLGPQSSRENSPYGARWSARSRDFLWTIRSKRTAGTARERNKIAARANPRSFDLLLPRISRSRTERRQQQRLDELASHGGAGAPLAGQACSRLDPARFAVERGLCVRARPAIRTVGRDAPATADLGGDGGMHGDGLTHAHP